MRSATQREWPKSSSRTFVHKGKNKGRGCYAPALLAARPYRKLPAFGSKLTVHTARTCICSGTVIPSVPALLSESPLRPRLCTRTWGHTSKPAGGFALRVCYADVAQCDCTLTAAEGSTKS